MPNATSNGQQGDMPDRLCATPLIDLILTCSSRIANKTCYTPRGTKMNPNQFRMPNNALRENALVVQLTCLLVTPRTVNAEDPTAG